MDQFFINGFFKIFFNMLQKSPRGISIIGLLLILSSIAGMIYISNYKHYVFCFRFLQGLPIELIKIRYIISWSLRIIGMMIGLGILLRKDVFRKLAMGLGYFSIVTVGIRHVQPDWLFRTMYSAIDIVFSVGMIIYFARPQIRGYFK